MKNTTLGIGLAGLGRHGQRYAQHLLRDEVSHAHLAAVWRRNTARAETWASEHGVASSESLEALIDDERVDAVVLVLPPGLHAKGVELAAEAGKPVLVEKPLAAHAAEARNALDAVQRAGVPAMVAQTLRFNHVVKAMKKELTSIGPVHIAALNQRFEPVDLDWLDDEQHGGVILNTGVHGVDLLHFLTGARITDVSARSGRRAEKAGRKEDHFAALLHLEPGPILATLDNSRATGGRSGRIEMVGERGQLVGDHVHGHLARIEERRWIPLDPGPMTHTVCETLIAFVDSVRNGSPVPIPLEDGLAAVEAVEAILESSSIRS